MSTLAQARANVESLLNLFDGLKQLGETLATAEAAVTVAAEKQALIDVKVKELDAITAQVEAAKANEAQRSADAEAAHGARLREQDNQMESISASFRTAKDALETQLKELQTKHDADATALAEEIRTLTQTRDDVQSAVDALTAQLAQLKSTAASL